MQSFCCYCDEASLSALESLDEKILLVGGDFGYPNFGDIAQLLSTIALHRRVGRYKIVLIMAVDAIGDAEFPAFMRRTYGADAVVFMSPIAQDFADSGLVLQRIQSMRNVGALHLYGGGFFNDQWGEYVVNIIEYLLRSVQPTLYFASGLQITSPFEERVLQHVRNFRPALFGVRDELSHQWMTATGYEPSFSFDDATEELQKVNANMPLRHGKGLLMHVNVSGYTDNATSPSGIPHELALLASRPEARSGITILQAYGDRRLEVLDAREAIKELERAFPFADYRVLELSRLAFEGWPSLATPLEGAIGYSSSYHVTLWLQLAGIPCWLRGSNLFYQQKRHALQVTQDFEAFMNDPQLADHSLNLERRGEWLAQVEDLIGRGPSLMRKSQLQYPDEAPVVPWRFKGNGMRQWIERSKSQDQRIGALDAHVGELNSVLDTERQQNQALKAEAQRTHDAMAEMEAETERLRAQTRGLSAKVTELGSSTHSERRRADALVEQLDRVRTELDQITVSENSERQRADEERARMAALSLRLAELEARYNAANIQHTQIINSRTWRMTKPLRFAARLLRGDWVSARAGVRRMLGKS